MEDKNLTEMNETVEPIEADSPLPEEPSDPTPAEESSVDSADEIASLQAEVERLRTALTQKEQEQKKIMREMEDFSRFFPTTSVKEIPESVWKDVETGIPLSAAYALYEKKSCMDRLHAEEINRRNAEQSAGRAGLHTSSEYYSPDEVRAMSPSEVRENYKKIRESMKKWRH
ncbi:MAG: hypothetical protein IKA76_01130 [Clostridia bacterium]|nr:hypothetical protein [Clostridia bacterium]